MESGQQLNQHDLQNNSIPNQKSKKQEEFKTVSFFQLFRFADSTDIKLIIVGTLGAIGIGVMIPVFVIIFGALLDSFQNFSEPDAIVTQVRNIFFIYIGIAVLIFLVGWAMYAAWIISGQRQTIRCRKQYLKSLLRQQIGWFDIVNQNELTTTFVADTFSFQSSIGQKFSTMIQMTAMTITAIVIAFVKGWLMTVVTMSLVPFLAIKAVAYTKLIYQKQKTFQKQYKSAGAKTQQALYGVKTVKMLNGQSFQVQNYIKALQNTSKSSLKYAFFTGLSIGAIYLFMMATYALGLWWGSVLIQNKYPNVGSGIYTPGDVMIVFFNILMLGFNLGQVFPSFKKVLQGRQAAHRIFKIIDREPLITNPQNGIIISQEKFKGKVKLQNVTFAYPKQPSRKILNRINIEFDANNSALVGDSGCGKSTILQLLLRFYDPQQGKITLDGVDIKQIDLIWLRNVIGYVGQQPVLFDGTIKQNMKFAKEDATDTQIQNALKMAEAYDFVNQLSNKMDTEVGLGGNMLSGGQKQRIAIARALLKKPKIMLFDEATSALDRRNERLIQQTLDSISKNLTSITVAHRIKTIMKSDVIYVLERGRVKQFGRFQQLTRFKEFQTMIKQEQVREKEQTSNSQQQDKKQALTKKQSKKKEFFNKEYRPGFLDFGFKSKKNDNSNNINQSAIIQQENTKKGKIKLKTKQQQQRQEQKKITQQYEKQIFSRIFKYSNDKIPQFIIGLLIAIANGTIYPIFVIFFGQLIDHLFNLYSSPTQEIRDRVNLLCWIFIILGVCSLICNIFQAIIFSNIGQATTQKLRIQTYTKMLKMPIPWFQNKRNNASALSARLSHDCQSVNSLTTSVFSILVQSLSSIVSGIIIAFIFEWRITLVTLAVIPFMLGVGVIQAKKSAGFTGQADQLYQESTSIIMQAMINIRTVVSFGYQNIVLNRYSQKLEGPYQISIKKGNISGILFGLSQFILYFAFGLIFYLAVVFAINNPSQISRKDIFVTIFVVFFSAMSAGNNLFYMPDVGQAKNSAANLFLILDSIDQDQLQMQSESKLIKEGIKGNIQVRNLYFNYLKNEQDQQNNEKKINKNEKYVIDNLSIKLNYGQKIAFVGPSGCGKSTLIQLLLNFYKYQKGQILIDNVQVNDYDVHYLRSCFGVVGQEPVIFNESFANNIKYNTNASQKQIQQAARKANALSFIIGNQAVESKNQTSNENCGNGFDRNVGVKGSHISGGQKQRIAIARAILRNPLILLLDEATSALDSENQKKVQDSLDLIMKDKTSISIAHRLQTIRNSDNIFVMHLGKNVEFGNYDQLLKKKGYFYNLEKGLQFV